MLAPLLLAACSSSYSSRSELLGKETLAGRGTKGPGNPPGRREMRRRAARERKGREWRCWKGSCRRRRRVVPETARRSFQWERLPSCSISPLLTTTVALLPRQQPRGALLSSVSEFLADELLSFPLARPLSARSAVPESRRLRPSGVLQKQNAHVQNGRAALARVVCTAWSYDAGESLEQRTQRNE